MFEQVTNQAVIWKVVSGAFGVFIPILMLVIWKKKMGGKIMPALAGAVIFITFAQILEGIPKLIFFTGNTSIANYVWSHTWAYVLIGCLQAGIFEETGRYFAFRFLLKKYQNKKNAITYGIGHGGMESVIVLGIAGISSIGMAAAINTGTFEQGLGAMSTGQMKSVELQVASLIGYGFATMLIDVLERIMAMTLHIALSVVVFKAVREKKTGYLLLAILLHGIFDIPAALYQCSAISRWFAELLLFTCAILIAVYAGKIYKNLKVEQEISK